MKTFAEAFEECIPCAPLGADEETVNAVIARSAELGSRSLDLTAEVFNHLALIHCLTAIYDAMDCDEEAFLNMFMMGLRIGMAMERSETGGVVIE